MTGEWSLTLNVSNVLMTLRHESFVAPFCDKRQFELIASGGAEICDYLLIIWIFTVERKLLVSDTIFLLNKFEIFYWNCYVKVKLKHP